jgi:hypothetical protein
MTAVVPRSADVLHLDELISHFNIARFWEPGRPVLKSLTYRVPLN